MTEPNQLFKNVEQFTNQSAEQPTEQQEQQNNIPGQSQQPDFRDEYSDVSADFDVRIPEDLKNLSTPPQSEGGQEQFEKEVQNISTQQASIQKQPEQQEQQQDPFEKEYKILVSKYISGYLLLLVIDCLAPDIVLFIFAFFNKKAQKIKSEDISLSEEQIQQIEPIADIIVKSWLIRMRPLEALFFLLTVNYSLNIYFALNTNKKRPNK